MDLDLRMSFSFAFLSRDFCSAHQEKIFQDMFFKFGKNGFRANNRFMLNFFRQRSARPSVTLPPFMWKKYSFLVLSPTQQMR